MAKKKIAAGKKEAEIQKSDRKRQTILGVIVVAVLIAVLCVVGYFIWRANRPSSSSSSSTSTSQQERKEAEAELASVKVKPSAALANGGFLVSKNGLNKPISGVPTISIYMDFICPACGEVDRDIDNTLIQMVNAGQVNVEIHPEAFLNDESTDEYSSRAAGAAVYVAQYEPDKLLDVVRAFFASDYQPKESQNYKPVSNAMISAQLEKAGVSAAVAQDAVKGKYVPWVNAQTSMATTDTALEHPSGQLKGEITTPTFIINGHYWLFDEAWSQTGSPLTSLLKAIGLTQDQVGTSTKPKLGSKGEPLFPTASSSSSSSSASSSSAN
ncbi:MAG: thioredoxin domain-containing protein [Aeriscardovia sp.]|nr:thioredoxin domain-containing protein [Aeriscardovia sp.]